MQQTQDENEYKSEHKPRQVRNRRIRLYQIIAFTGTQQLYVKPVVE